MRIFGAVPIICLSFPRIQITVIPCSVDLGDSVCNPSRKLATALGISIPEAMRHSNSAFWERHQFPEPSYRIFPFRLANHQLIRKAKPLTGSHTISKSTALADSTSSQRSLRLCACSPISSHAVNATSDAHHQAMVELRPMSSSRPEIAEKGSRSRAKCR